MFQKKVAFYLPGSAVPHAVKVRRRSRLPALSTRIIAPMYAGVS